jgi:hypothetical protein
MCVASRGGRHLLAADELVHVAATCRPRSSLNRVRRRRGARVDGGGVPDHWAVVRLRRIGPNRFRAGNALNSRQRNGQFIQELSERARPVWGRSPSVASATIPGQPARGERWAPGTSAPERCWGGDTTPAELGIPRGPGHPNRRHPRPRPPRSEGQPWRLSAHSVTRRPPTCKWPAPTTRIAGSGTGGLVSGATSCRHGHAREQRELRRRAPRG